MQVSDGIITDSTMDVIDEYMIVNSTEDGQAAPGEIAITVADSDSFTFTSESKSIDASVVGDGYYSNVTAENADSVTVSEDGASLRGDKVDYSVTQSASSNLCQMFSCSGTIDGSGTISFLDGRINVSGHAGGDVTLEVFINGIAQKFSARSYLKNLSISIADLLDPSIYNMLWELIKNADIFGLNLYQVTRQEGAPEIEPSNIQEVSAVVLGTEALYKYIELVASPLDGTAPEADKAALISKADELGATAGTWFDLSLFANDRASNKHLEQVATVETPLNVSITVPKELQKAGRTFFVLSAHDGKVELVATGSKETLTWSNTGFSTFLLAYADEPPAPSAADKASGSKNEMTFGFTSVKIGSASSASTGKASAAPKTGDSIPLGAIAILIFAGLAALAVSRSRLNRGDDKRHVD